jgi:hypothetical protein
MADKKNVKRYKCTNYGACTKADNNEEIEFDALETLGGTPECPSCHQHTLEEIVSKPFPTKLIGIIAAAIILIGGAIGAFFAMSGGQEIDKIKLSEKTLTLVLGESPKALLTATAIDKDSNEVKDANVKFIWNIKDENIAKVTQGGEVTALKKGKTIVTVKIEGDDQHRSTCQVEVKEPEGDSPEPKTQEALVEQITPSATVLEMTVGDKQALTYSTTPDKVNEEVGASVSDDNIITFTASGEIVALKAGKATVTFVASKSGKEATVEVTVKEKNTGGGKTGGNGGGSETYVRNANLGYGTYTGEVKPGTKTPHGHGTMVYSTTHRIAGSYTADRGDKYEGEFRDGRPSGGIGYWTHDGNVTTINP